VSAGGHLDLGSSIGFGMIRSGGMARIHAEAIRSGATGTRLVVVSGGTRAGGRSRTSPMPSATSTGQAVRMPLAS
jgi:hypothetical protein